MSQPAKSGWIVVLISISANDFLRAPHEHEIWDLGAA
jgi:hypothetical protein